MLKINVGFNRKVGEAITGLGRERQPRARTRLQLVGDPNDSKIASGAVWMAKASVDEELHSQPATNGHANGSHVNGNGQSNGRRRDNTRRATASQVRALNAIAGDRIETRSPAR